jgi:hypothetical protein
MMSRPLTTLTAVALVVAGCTRPAATPAPLSLGSSSLETVTAIDTVIAATVGLQGGADARLCRALGDSRDPLARLALAAQERHHQDIDQSAYGHCRQHNNRELDETGAKQSSLPMADHARP